MTSQARVPIHRLPLPPTTLQASLPQLTLDPSPLAQRRSTTFQPATDGIWARNVPMWTSWPLRVTKEELLEMGVDVDQGGQVKVVDVLARWDPVDLVPEDQEAEGGAVKRYTSKHRLKLDAYLLGISPAALRDSLPHLDAGDAPFTSPDIDAQHPVKALTDVLSGRHVLANEDGSYGPWSTRYCGHQFGVWAGQLGDGRAISVLETTSAEGGRQEIQLKGAGRTPFSRHADGLAVLRSGIREYLGCEAVAALQIPTTRSLALLTAFDLPVIRETGPEPTSLTARLAPSFIRIGHFEALSPSKSARDTRQLYFGGGWQGGEDDAEQGPLRGQGNLEGLGSLVRWCKGIMAELGWLEKGAGAREFFDQVVKRNAEMVAGWQAYGFCHGVINTDNVSILGLTIDYGPYAFLDVYDENHICNHSDPSGLYSYKNQPSRILYALDKLQQALAPLIGYEALNEVDDQSGWSEGAQEEDVDIWREKAAEEMKGWEERFWQIQRDKERELWLKRFGLKTYTPSDDREIILSFLTKLNAFNMDFHTSFRRLSYFSPTQAAAAAGPDSETYLSTFIESFVQAGIVARQSSEVEQAIDGWREWFKLYAERAGKQEEQDGWASTISPSHGAVPNGDGRAHEGNSENGISAEAGDKISTGKIPWEAARQAGMNATNPRFVLRQWVLEELIKDVQAEVEKETDEGKLQARKKLAGIMTMSSEPYELYGEDVGDGVCPTEEVEEQRRLCGLGSREMLGFQCSCSS